MTPMTRKMLREASEDEQARAAYPPRPARCEHRIRRTGSRLGWYVGQCKRAARASGLCWQHERQTGSYDCPCGWSRVILDGQTADDARRAHEQTAVHAIAMAERSATR